MVSKDWNVFPDPRPYVTVSGFVVDNEGRFPLLHRSEKVRSARNCWSLPSGLHEVGKTGPEQFAAEIEEELGLQPIPGACQFINIYENIRPDGPELPGWHWFIGVYVQKVVTLDGLINKEPDKHDAIQIVNPYENPAWMQGRVWAPKLEQFILSNLSIIVQGIETIRRA
jgi:ADP-ribose pyrophosphatase YjhB (NUDIX family)